MRYFPVWHHQSLLGSLADGTGTAQVLGLRFGREEQRKAGRHVLRFTVQDAWGSHSRVCQWTVFTVRIW